MGKYRYNTLMEYLPVRYSASEQQQKDRKEIYQFKDGNCSSHIKDGIIRIINSLNIVDKSSWCVCFIPASTNLKTRWRYEDLSEAIQSRTGISCSYTAISDIRDRESGYKTGKKTNPAEDFTVNGSFVKGKHVILIDDIITRGRTFESTADKLINTGAKEVTGIFVAKTINPDWDARKTGNAGFAYFDPSDMYEDDFDPSEMYNEDDFDPSDMCYEDDFDPSDMDQMDDFDPSDMY